MLKKVLNLMKKVINVKGEDAWPYVVSEDCYKLLQFNATLYYDEKKNGGRKKREVNLLGEWNIKFHFSHIGCRLLILERNCTGFPKDVGPTNFGNCQSQSTQDPKDTLLVNEEGKGMIDACINTCTRAEGKKGLK
jgi:hypothetical protein